MKLLFTPPVMSVLTVPLPLAGIVRIFRGGDDAFAVLGIGWVIAFGAIILWLLFVAPIVQLFGRGRDGHWKWLRVLMSSMMGGFVIGALLGGALTYFAPGIFELAYARTMLGWGFIHSYVALVAAFFLMRDPFFRLSGGKV